MKKLVIIIAVIAGIIGAAVLFGKDSEQTGTLSNHVYGTSSTGVAIVEYGDFECPACGFFFPIVQEIKEKYKDQVSFQFRNNPLVQIHQNALASHRAAEAAHKQGKFWEMHDILYQRQEEWNGPSANDSVGVTTAKAIELFESYAQEIGLNIEQYKTDVAAPDVIGTINADTAEGKRLGVTGTPTFFIDGKRIDDTSTISSVDAFSKLIDEAIAARAAQPSN